MGFYKVDDSDSFTVVFTVDAFLRKKAMWSVQFCEMRDKCEVLCASHSDERGNSRCAPTRQSCCTPGKQTLYLVPEAAAVLSLRCLYEYPFFFVSKLFLGRKST